MTKRFWVKALLALLPFVIAGLYFQSRFKVTVDRQLVTSLDARVMVVDMQDTTPRKGEVFAFYAPESVAPVMKPGILMAKIFVAQPGDTVEVKPNKEITVNGEVKARGLAHLYGAPPQVLSRFYGKRTLKDDEWWVLGTNEWSFDSRYWGSVSAKNVFGRAYVLW